MLQEKPDVSLLECMDCHAASASQMPTPEALTDYYSRYYDTPVGRPPDEHVTNDNPARFARHLADLYASQRRDSYVSILDFGGGDGSISHLLAVRLLEHGTKQVDITVVDYDETLKTPQDSRISIRKAPHLSNVKNDFVFVLASGIIEHIPRPIKPFRDLLDRLEPGGVFYARTPHMLPLMKFCGLLGIRLDFTYPAHVHDLGQAFWEHFFRSGNALGEFQLLRSRPSIVETTFGRRFLRTAAAYAFKAPWYVLGKSYGLVGGWEVFVRKTSPAPVGKTDKAPEAQP
ncbi:MAG: methyltransferase domain-containing protein [Planctomycetota bacterium]